MQPNTVSAIYQIWAAVGPLVGILIGNHLVRFGQRKQWIANEQVKEWRELLGTITGAFTAIILSYQRPVTSESLAQRVKWNQVALEVLNNRIFIAEELRRKKILDRWFEAVGEFDKHQDSVLFGAQLRPITDDIEQAARADISKV
jgi:hypothetical protein